jgi:hypothetical protein
MEDHKDKSKEETLLSLFAKLPKSFADRFLSQVSLNSTEVLHQVALDLVNESRWNVRAGDWILLATAFGAFTPEVIHAVAYSPHHFKQEEENRNGILHIMNGKSGKQNQTCRFETLTKDNLSTIQFVPVLESIEKTMEMIQLLFPTSAILLIPPTKSFQKPIPFK